MQRPNPGELLKGLRRSLEDEVLPALPRGVPHQQMKAALHLIGRLERSWDLTASHLRDDNADIEAVLAAAIPTGLAALLDSRIAAIRNDVTDGYNDRDLAAAARRNAALHEILCEQDDTAERRALFGRMAERDAVYVGDRPQEDQTGQ